MPDFERTLNRKVMGHANSMDDVLHGFGVAAYNAQVMERKVIILLSTIFAAKDPDSAHRAYDCAIETNAVKTLGRLVQALGREIDLPDGLDERLQQALKSRNRLIHDFFCDHAEDELSADGRSTILQELAEMSASFFDLAGEIEIVTTLFVSKFTGEVLRVRGLPDSLATSVDSLLADTERELDVMRQRARWRDGGPGT